MPELALADGETRLREQLAAAWAEVRTLRRTVAHQARLLEHLAPETHPAAPSVACLYWLYSLAHEHAPGWYDAWLKLQPSLRGLGSLPAPEVTPVVWARHVAQRRHEVHRLGRPPCDQTLNVELSRLKALLSWAVANQMLAYNPLQAAKRTKTRCQRETRLTPADIDQLLHEAESLRDRRVREGDDDGHRSKMLQAAALVWHDSMMRFNEGRHLRRSHIQANGDYMIPRDDTKTDAGERTVTLTPRTLEAIARVPVHPASDYVFVNMRTGKLLSKSSLYRWFRWTAASSRLDAKAAPRDRRLVIHHLRHAGATAADAAGVRPGALSTVLGHKDPRTTSRYVHREKSESARHVAEMIQAATDRVGPQKKKRTRK
jgi:site-specific recombinase XerD